LGTLGPIIAAAAPVCRIFNGICAVFGKGINKVWEYFFPKSPNKLPADAWREIKDQMRN